MSGEMPVEQVEAALRETASGLSYPPTPDIAGAVWQRLVREGAPVAGQRRGRGLPRRAWAGFAVAAALVLAVTLAVPEARAVVGSVIARIGSIAIIVQQATPTLTPLASSTQGPTPTEAPDTDIADWIGATTFEEAQRQVDFSIQVPGYPPSLGMPERVFVQDRGGPAVVLVWLQPGHPDQIRLVLYQMTSEMYAQKLISGSTVLTDTTVYGQRVLWVQGPHVLEFRDVQAAPGESTPFTRRMVNGNVLVWEKLGITYRLEGAISMEEAVRMSQSFEILLPTPAPQPSLVPVPTNTVPPADQVLQRLVGEITLDKARERVGFPVKLPEYPTGLGRPDKVFVQGLGEPVQQSVLVLVWLELGTKDKVKMALYELPNTVEGIKTIQDISELQPTSVNGQQAQWVLGTHMLELRGGDGKSYQESRRLVSGHVLLWEEGDVTYRLESTLPLGEAVRVAESLR